MAYASRLGRARVDPSHPQAAARCDRCQSIYNRVDLSWQYDFRGKELRNIRLLVCRDCTDKPFQHWKPIVTGPDPIPILDPRPEDYVTAEGLNGVVWQNAHARDVGWVDSSGNEVLWTVPYVPN